MTESEAAADPPAKIWNRRFTSVFAASASMYLALFMMNSLIAKYADHLGASATVVGVVSSMFAVSAVFFKLFSGTAIDTFNRRHIVTCAMIVMMLSFFGYSISRGIPMLIIFRLLQGSAQAFTATCCLALAADSLPPDKIGAGVGVYTSAQAASQAIGPPVALALMERFGYTATFMTGGFMMIFAIFMSTRINIPFTRTKKFRLALNSIIAKEALMPATLLFFMTLSAGGGAFLILFAQARNVSNIGYYFTVNAVFLLLTRPLAGHLADRFGLVKLIIPALFFFALSYILISFSATLPMFLLSSVVSAFGLGACMPAIQSYSLKSVPPERRGSASTTNYLGMDIPQMFSAVIAGFLVDNFGYEAMWRIMIFPVAITMALVIANRAKLNRKSDSV